jgi:hypothetical protein
MEICSKHAQETKWQRGKGNMTFICLKNEASSNKKVINFFSLKAQLLNTKIRLEGDCPK